MAKKQIQLNFFENTSCGNASCMGQWRNSLDKASTKDRAQYYINLAKLAEKGKITSVFFTDGYGSHEVYESSASANLIGGGHVGQLDPVPFVAPMALATEMVGIVVTGSSSYLNPYPMARTWSKVLYPLGDPYPKIDTRKSCTDGPHLDRPEVTYWLLLEIKR
ncbi:hypothetical protein N431DRAFT_468911 [Stipitochalara longipes BDJ]|nr:hypothetical protein N431DRAFT_468911 [Stipitochalara longipes BDJ]